MTGENDTRKKYPIGSAEGRAEADRRIAEANSTGATKLDLGGLGLIEIPAGLFALRHLAALKQLHLSKNQLSALPAEIGQLAALEELYLNKNQLRALPAEIGRLAALEVLDLHDNKLSALPAEIGRLAALERLYLNKNQLRALPAEIGELAALEVLDLNKNQLSALPAEIGHLAALKRLHLNENQLSALPATEIMRLLPALERLDLKNQLSALPAEIGHDVNLSEADRRIAKANSTGATELDLAGLGLLEIPVGFFALKQLASLELLDLSDNELSALPAEIGQLAALERLYLSDNQLSALPAEIGRLATLEVLYLYKNQLRELPAEIGRLAALKRLDLNNNQLSALPAEIGRLAALERLDLSDNRLSALPAEIGRLAALKRLDLDNNRLAPWFEKVLAEGGIAGFRALLKALYENAAPLFEAKLLVTGAGKVGKSWALAALRGENPHETVGEQTTYGVYCGELLLPHPGAGKNSKVPAGTAIHLNTWDFGGQNLYRITHQFFFTEQAIFLLVWNPRDGAEKCGVREWLRMIKLRTGGNAKVIMVASHCPRGKTPYLPIYGRDRLPSELSAMIVDEIAIDSELGDNVQELRDMIARHAAGLDFMGGAFPASWQKARQAVAALNPPGGPKRVPHITYEHFLDICRENGVSDEYHMFTLATVFMHNMGRAIYYGERHRLSGSDALLANIMVLDSEWLSRAFVQVLEDRKTNDSGGMLDHAWLDRIWRTHGRDDWLRFPWQEHPFLIRLMHAFDMSYVVRGSNGDRSLVPQLLPSAEPELPWRVPPDSKDAKPVRLICKMENEAHGLMPRFIVQTAPYHIDARSFWRDGVFLREPTYGTEALVTVEGTEKPVMSLTVAGAQPPRFLGELHRTLKELLAFWPGLNKTFYVGCPTRRPDGGFCKGEFEFQFLVDEDKAAPEDRHACQVCRTRYSPRELLSGYRITEEQRVQAVHAWSLAKQQAPCPRAFTLTPADRSKYDPRQFAPEKIAGKKLKLTLLSEHSLKEVVSKEFGVSPGWMKWIGPLAHIGSLALSGMALPMTGLEAKEFDYAAKVMKDVGGVSGDGSLSKHAKKAGEGGPERADWPSGSDLEDLHKLLQAIDLAPHFCGMKFVKIRGKGYLWVSKEEAEAFAEETPTLAYIPNKDLPDAAHGELPSYQTVTVTSPVSED